MPEGKKQEAIRDVHTTHSKVHLFINSTLVTLEGMWEWSLQTNELFCSDVYFMLPLPQKFEGTRCFIHPDDLPALQESIAAFEKEYKTRFYFRVITTHGEVHEIQGEGKFAYEADEIFLQKLQGRVQENFIHTKELQLQKTQLEEQLKAHHFAGQKLKSGVWYVNTVSHLVHYSDGVYHIHDLLPQSLNPYLHTFVPFLHPQDREAVTEAFNAAYTQQVPLDITYRIVTNSGHTKHLRQSLCWRRNEKGEWMLYGMVADISDEKAMVAEVAASQDEIALQRGLLLNNEVLLRSANWHIHLVTRKAVYTEGIYRIFGIRHTGLVFNTSVLLTLVHPEDQAMVADAYKKIFKEHLPPDLEYRIIRPDGKTRYLRQKGKLMVNSAQQFIITGTTQDVTDEIIRNHKIETLKHEQFVTDTAFAKTEELAGTGSWMWDVLSGEIKWSTGFYTLLGYKNANIKPSQKLLLSLVHPEDRDVFSHEVREMLEGKKESNISFRLVRKDGTRNIAASLKLVQADGHILFLGTFEDRTTLHQIEEQLKEHVKLAELLSDASPDKILVTDVHNTIIRWNQPCEAHYGLMKDKAIGKNIFDLLPALKNSEVLQNFHKALNGETIQLHAQKGIVAKGVHNLLMQPIKDEEGQVIAVLHVIHDVTRELELQGALTNRLQFIERLLSASIDRIIVLDKNMNYQYWNKRAEEYYGIAKEEVIGRNILELFPAFVNDPSYTELRTALRGEVVHIPANADLQAKKGYYETYLLPIKDDTGEISSVLWIVHDLSKEFILQRNRKKTLETLDALNENYFELDTEFKFTYVNKKALGFFGKMKADLTGTVIWDAFPELVDSPLYFAINHTLEEQVSTLGEFIFPVKKIQVYVSIVPSLDGIIVGFFDISHLKETEKKLEEHQKFIQQVTEASPDVVTVFDLQQQNLVYVNRTLANLLGYTTAHLNDMGHEGRLQTIIHPEDRQKVVDLNKEMAHANDEEVRSLEYRLVCKNGNVKWVRNRCKIFRRNEDGLVTHLLSVLQDITQQIETGNQLKESELFLGSIMAATLDYIMVFDLLKQKTVFVNRSAYKDDEERYQETLHLNYDGLLQRAHPDDREALHQYIQSFKHAPDNQIRSLEYRVMKEGGNIWYKSRGKVFKRTDTGNPLQYISVVQDITAEVNLRTELVERIAYAENLIDSSVDSMLVIDDALIIRAWNRRCEELYGYSKKDILGKCMTTVFPDLLKHTALMQQINNALNGAHVYLPAEAEVYGNVISEKYLIPIQNNDGKTTSLLIVLHDVTAAHQAKEELKALNTSLEQKNKELAQKHDEITSFAFVASHDLREPLRKIHTFSDWLLEQEKDKLSVSGKDYLNRICAATRRMEMLIADVLALSKIHSITEEFVGTDLNGVMGDVIKELRTEIEASGAVIVYEALPALVANPNQLFYLLRNLVHNSIKFKKAGETPHIYIKAQAVKASDPDTNIPGADAAYMAISVTDNGIGIAPRYFGKIFQVFQQLHDKHEKGGTGMGLAICRKIMENHKGVITVKSTVGEGSVFSCFFPQ